MPFVERVRRDLGAFRRLSVIERVTGSVLAACVAFVTFIFGLVLLFDHVNATKGHSTTAWTLSLLGLVLSALLGVCAGGSVITTYGRRSADRRRPLPQSILIAVVISPRVTNGS